MSDRYIKEAGAPEGKIKIEVADFFSLEGTTFDLIYDYTYVHPLIPIYRTGRSKRSCVSSLETAL